MSTLMCKGENPNGNIHVVTATGCPDDQVKILFKQAKAAFLPYSKAIIASNYALTFNEIEVDNCSPPSKVLIAYAEDMDDAGVKTLKKQLGKALDGMYKFTIFSNTQIDVQQIPDVGGRF